MNIRHPGISPLQLHDRLGLLGVPHRCHRRFYKHSPFIGRLTCAIADSVNNKSVMTATTNNKRFIAVPGFFLPARLPA
jgi:hypothetical protein